MARTVTTAQRNAISAQAVGIWYKLETTNAAGTWVDLSTNVPGATNVDFVNSATLIEDIDQNTMMFNAVLLREAGGVSLSPLVAASPANASGAFLDDKRLWRLSIAIPTTYGTNPVAGDWKVIGIGYIERFDMGSSASTIQLSGRCLGAKIADAYIARNNITYGSTNGVALETVLQQMLDNTLGAGVCTLAVPVASNVLVPTFAQDYGNLLDAMNQLANKFGFVVRYMFDASDNFNLTLYKPNRAATTPAWSLGPSEYLDLPLAVLDISGVRNFIELRYVNASTGALSYVTSPAPLTGTVSCTAGAATFSASQAGVLQNGSVIVVTQMVNGMPNYVPYTVSAFNGTTGCTLSGTPTFSGCAWTTSASLTRFGLLFMAIDQQNGSQINSASAAQGMADATRSDIELPNLEQQLVSYGLWFAQLYDYGQFLANGVQYDADQFGGVTHVEHALAGGTMKTTLNARGKPAGRYRAYGTLAADAATPGIAGTPNLSVVPGTMTTTAQPYTVTCTDPANQNTPILTVTIRTGLGGTAGTGPNGAMTDGVTYAVASGAVITANRSPYASKPASISFDGDMTPFGGGAVQLQRTITNQDAAALNSNGSIIRTVVMSDGAYAAQASNSAGTNLSSAVTDSSGSRAVNRFLAKALTGDADSLDGLPEGTTYNRVVASRVSSGKPWIDFAEAININKFTHNLQRSSGDATALDVIVQNLSNSGNAGSGMTDSGSRALNRFLAKALTGDADSLDGVIEGTSYKRVLASRVSSGKPWIDFSESIHANKTADYIGDGATYRVMGLTESHQNLAPAALASSVLYTVSAPGGFGAVRVPLASLGLSVGDVFSYSGLITNANGTDTQAAYFYHQFYNGATELTEGPDAYAPSTSSTAEQLAKSEGNVVPANCTDVVFGFYTTRPSGASGRRLMVNRGPRAIPFTDAPLRLNRDTVDVVQDGTTYGRIALTDRTNVVNTLDASGVKAGKLIRARAYDDGWTALKSGSSDGRAMTSDAYESGGRLVNRFYAKGLSGDPDTADAFSGHDGVTNRVPTLTEATGGGRGYTGLDGSGRLQTGINSAADISGINAANLARAQGAGVFTDNFEGGVGNWHVVNGPGSIVPALSQAGVDPAGYGLKCLQVTGEAWVEYLYNIPFDASKIYRMRVGYTPNSYGGGSAWPFYAGLACYGSDGTTRINTLGANTVSGSHYLVAYGAAPGFNGGSTMVYEGWFKGNGTPFNAPTVASNPTPLYPGVMYFRPLVIGNFGSTSAGYPSAQCSFSYVEITEYDDTGTSRVYNTINSSNRVAGPRNIPMCRIANVGGITTIASVISGATWNSTAGQWQANINGHTFYRGDGTYASVNSGSVLLPIVNTTYYIYADDAAQQGGALTFQASSLMADAVGSSDRRYIGSITSGASGGGGTPGTPTGGGSTGGACFVAGTLITRHDGTLVPIEQVRVGECVRAFADTTLETLPARVEATHVHEIEQLLVIEGDLGYRVETTIEHPFLTEAGWMRAGNLRAGMRVYRDDYGALVPLRLTHVAALRRPCTVYNLTVERWHVYLANGYAVHNVKLQ